MRALSIRQPYAEMILRGIKRIEYRSRRTNIVGQRFWIYASKGRGTRGEGRGIWSEDLTGTAPPPWIVELANSMHLFKDELPTGVIVGSAVISHCSELKADSRSLTTMYEWHLTDVERATRLRKPTGHPQPVWFEPF